MDQACLRGLQLAKSSLGCVARRPNLSFGPLPFGDVAVDQHKAAAGHRVVSHLDYAPVWTGTLDRPLPSDILGNAVPFGLDIDGAELAALGKITEILLIAAPFRQQLIGYVKDFLKVVIPGGKSQFGVEHRDAVTHVIEGDPQFGLTPRQFVGAST